MLTPLSQLFVTERHRLRAGGVGHSVPLASEVDVPNAAAVTPVMISSTRGTFLKSRVSATGYLRFGFSTCPLSEEGALLWEFRKQLVFLARENKWHCITETPESAVARMRANGEEPFHLVAGPWLETDEIEGARVLDVGLPTGVALLVTNPIRAGLYTRIGDYVGVLAYRVDRSFVAVVPP